MRHESKLWTVFDRDNTPGFRDSQCLVTCLDGSDGARYVKLAKWNGLTRSFAGWGDVAKGDVLLAWVKISPPTDPTGDFPWIVGEIDSAMCFKHILIWGDDGHGKGEASFFQTERKDKRFVFWAMIPEPFYAGDGSPWVMPPDGAYQRVWKLRNNITQRRLNSMTGGMEFGRELDRACQSCVTLWPELVYVHCKGLPSSGHKILKGDVVLSQAYKKNDWNTWPEVVPPRRYVIEQRVFCVEYKNKDSNAVSCGCYCFDGERFYNGKEMLVEGEEVGLPTKARFVKLVRFRESETTFNDLGDVA
ncbi:MAG: hypothetical protein Q4E62_08850 [Sutterellaceae bacterium]|nr:hypothetical protein [Sutterellaceae bacterium]